MDARFALIHLFCAIGALVAAATMSAPAGHPRARPWLIGALFVLGLGELYVVALSIGLTLMWPALHMFGVPWLLLPALLWRHFSESTHPSNRAAGAHWRPRHA